MRPIVRASSCQRVWPLVKALKPVHQHQHLPAAAAVTNCLVNEKCREFIEVLG